MQMTPKQDLFVQEYLVDLNARQAAYRAGYSLNSATEIGYENLRKPHIQAALQKAMQQRAERVRIDQDFVIRVLQQEAQGGGPDTSSAARIRAAKLLGRHLGMFTGRVDVEQIGPPPVIQVMFDDPPKLPTTVK